MDSLLQAAAAAAQKAYAPYSDFRVGAAVLCADGSITTGNNQENASYSLTLCAERVALAKVFSENPSAVVIKIAIYAPCAEQGAIRPCGACLQYIKECAERCGTNIEVLMADGVMKISQLLPAPFVLDVRTQ